MGIEPSVMANSCQSLPIPLYLAATSIFKLLALHLPILLSSLIIVFKAGKRSVLSASLSALIVYILFIVSVTWALPSLNYPWMLTASALFGAVGAVLFYRSKQRPFFPRFEPGLSPAIFGWAAVIVLSLFFLVYALLSPAFDHDPLTYQLHFAATWLQKGKLFIVPTPYGDPSQAYGPSLASVYYMWLMAPLGTGMLAACGGWAFLLISLLAAGGLAKELGVTDKYTWAAPAFALLCPVFAHEGMSALSDIAVAAFLVSALYFFLRAFRKSSSFDLALAFASIGMMAGSKLSGAILSLLFLPLLALAFYKMRPARHIAAWGIGLYLTLMGGGIWYLRNTVASGNPVFPLRLSLGGVEIFSGLYGRKQMLGWLYHRSGTEEWLKIVEANSSLLFLSLIVAAILIISFRVLLGPDKSSGNIEASEASGPSPFLVLYLCLVPLLIDRLNWHLVPYQEYRFWVPAVPVAAAAITLAFGKKWFALFPALAISYAGLYFRFWPVPGLESDAILVQKLLAPLVLIAALASYAVWHFWSANKQQEADAKKFRSFRPLLVSAFVCLSAAFGLTVALADYPARRAEALSFYAFSRAWQSLPCSEHGITVAYTGSNIPYPLHGSKLENRVIYVAPSGRVMPQDHEIVREMSGKYLGIPKFNTPEPALSSLVLCERLWAAALVSEKTDYLFVTRVPKAELANNAHTSSGWPLEDEWARGANFLFTPVYEDDFARIYKLNLSADPARIRELGSCEDRPADAFSADYYSPDLLKKYFPRVNPSSGS